MSIMEESRIDETVSATEVAKSDDVIILSRNVLGDEVKSMIAASLDVYLKNKGID